MKKQICSNKTKIITMLLLVVMLLLATLAPIKSVGAESTALVSDGVVNSTVLSSLYKTITGSNTATYSDVLAYAQTDRTCATLKTNNGGTAITVNFGGFEWLGVYLTKSRTGDAILDLYLKERVADVSVRFCASGEYDCDYGYMYSYKKYPCELYATSYVRSYINNGNNKNGKIQYAYGFDEGNLKDFEGESVFAVLLNGTAWTKYITVPSEIEYQEHETYAEVGEEGIVWWNEAYGEPRSGEFVDDAVAITKEAYYSDWQYDYLWLPSVCEVNWLSNCNGMWQMSEEEMKYENELSSYWCRTGTQGAGGNAVIGGNYMMLTTTKNGVRPALHLNLTALNASTVANTGIATNILSVVTLGMSCAMFGLLLFFRKRTKRI